LPAGACIMAEAKINIANYFIQSSPTGEVNDVVTDVSKLVGDPAVLTEEAVAKMLRDYNQEHLDFAQDPSTGTLVLVSAFGRVNDRQYLNPNTNQVLTFNHKTHKFTDVVEGKSTLPANVAAMRASIARALEVYSKTNFAPGKVCAMAYASNEGKFTICISAKNVNLGNFWTGGWRAVYSFTAGTGPAELKASVKVNVHYFEDGNVQLHTAVDRTATVNVSDNDATANDVCKQIGKIENEFQTQLEEMYVKMHGTTFRQMRRFYSVTRQPMNWNTAAHALATEVTKSS